MTDDSGVVVQSSDYAAQVQEILVELQQLEHTPRLVCSAEELEAVEHQIRQLTDRLGALLVGRHMQHALDSAALQAEEAALVKGWPKALKNDGRETVMIRTGQGVPVAVRATYYRRKGTRRAGKRYPGLYAGLVVLGIHERCTPGMTSEVSMLVAMLGSLEEAQKVLLDRGLDVNIKTLRTITYSCARRARLVQCMEKQEVNATVAGRRVVIGCDGGRIRLRERKRGQKTKKGRTRYRGAWREPKLLIVFVADGAPWIWKRVAALVSALGLKPGQVYELLDFYHAVEHLAKVASLCKSWGAKQRKQWVTRYRRILLKGHVAQVIDAVRDLCHGRHSTAIRTQRDYFVKNGARMAYAQLMALNLPIGSGAVESAIRRVVNLRLKGPGIFWCKANAEAILMLRAYYKAGRWNILKQMANSPLSLLAA